MLKLKPLQTTALHHPEDSPITVNIQLQFKISQHTLMHLFVFAELVSSAAHTYTHFIHILYT